jgi:hypothetical protein
LNFLAVVFRAALPFFLFGAGAGFDVARLVAAFGARIGDGVPAPFDGRAVPAV